MIARISLSRVTPPGRNSGSITLAMNSTVTSGTPRHNSMKTMDAVRTTGSSERRPSASRMPSGSEITMPVTATTRVTSSPPQLEVSTGVEAEERRPPSARRR